MLRAAGVRLRFFTNKRQFQYRTNRNSKESRAYLDIRKPDTVLFNTPIICTRDIENLTTEEEQIADFKALLLDYETGIYS